MLTKQLFTSVTSSFIFFHSWFPPPIQPGHFSTEYFISHIIIYCDWMCVTMVPHRLSATPRLFPHPEYHLHIWCSGTEESRRQHTLTTAQSCDSLCPGNINNTCIQEVKRFPQTVMISFFIVNSYKILMIQIFYNCIW